MLDNSFARQYPVSEALMKPESSPTHYTDFEREIDEIPDRTWWSNVKSRLSRVVRLK